MCKKRIFPSSKDIERENYNASLLEEREKTFPKLIFKYKSISSAKDLARVCDILQSKKIYMPTLKQLNDPLESACSEWIGNETDHKTLENYRILSLSRNPFLSTMWAYYANNYSGICLGFKTNRSFSGIQEVDYYSKQNAIIWEYTTKDLLKKGTAWKHEAEWRIVHNCKNDEYFHFDANDLACIIFGCNIDLEIKKHIEMFIPARTPIFTIRADVSNFQIYAEGKKHLRNIEELQHEIDIN